MLRNIGAPELLVILFIAVLIFGAAKLPQIGRAMGDSIREFKKAVKDGSAEDGKDDKTEKTEQKN